MRLTAVHVAFLAGALAFGTIASAEKVADKDAKKPACSIHPTKDADDAALSKLAKLTRDDAEARARAHFAPDKPVSTNYRFDHPNVEGGCLVWDFQMTFMYDPPKKPSRARLRILVDAGDGKILSTEDVSPDYMKE